MLEKNVFDGSKKSLLRYDIYKPGKQYTKLKWFSGLSWKHQRTTYIKVHQKVRKIRPAQRCFFLKCGFADQKILYPCTWPSSMELSWFFFDHQVDIHTSSLFFGTSKKRCERSKSSSFHLPSMPLWQIPRPPSRKALKGSRHGFFPWFSQFFSGDQQNTNLW